MPTVIGLDIGNTSYRAVEISSKKTSKGIIFTLEKAFICEACVEKDPQKSVESLKNFIKESRFSTKDVVLALPESYVFSTTLSLPFKSEKEIKSHLDIQGSKIFPKPLSELVYSFQILGPSEQNKGETLVDVVACSKDFVEKLYSKVRTAGLKVMSVEPEAYSIVRALVKGQNPLPNEVFLVVNVGSIGSDMMVIRNGSVKFTRNISLGGVTFSKAISQSLNISEEQAEEYKKNYGLEDGVLEGKVREAVKPVAETLISEITRTIDFYCTRNSLVSFKKVIYSGGSAVMPGLMAYSAENLGVEVELANPFVGIGFSSKISSQKDKLINLGPVYTVAVGLAIKENIQ